MLRLATKKKSIGAKTEFDRLIKRKSFGAFDFYVSILFFKVSSCINENAKWKKNQCHVIFPPRACVCVK